MASILTQDVVELPAFAPRFGRVCILGLGKSGEGVAHFCRLAMAQHNPVIDSYVIYAGKRTDATATAAAPFMGAGAQVIFDTEVVEPGFDTCVVSPGISQNSDFYKSALAASSQLMSEPEFAYLLSPRNWIGITGTNGKTTTTALTTHLLREAGFSARAVGNIGSPCIDAVCNRKEGEYLVAELSSYQLASTHLFSPRVAVLLNITPDHLAWHGSHEAYIDAKMRIFANLDFDALAVVDVENPDAARCAQTLVERGVRLLRVEPGAKVATPDQARCDNGTLEVTLQGSMAHRLVDAADMHIKGAHNVANALAAASAALFCGANPEAVARGLVSFEPLEHRIEPCGSVDGIAYFNDSKATNVDSVLKALTAFGTTPLVLLLGGKDKGTALDELVAACDARCKAVVCYGQARERFLEAFKDSDIVVAQASGMLDAMDVARTLAEKGDAIVLSPACASFDEFNSFEHRGKVFKERVASYPGEHR